MSQASADWERIVDLLEEELASAGDAQAESALRCRLALLHWDLFGDRAAASASLTGTPDEDGVAVELRRQLLLDEGDVSAARALLARRATWLEQNGDAEGAVALLREAALLALFGSFDASETLAMLERVIALRSDEDSRVGDDEELLELTLALARDPRARAMRAVEEPVATLPVLLDGALALWDELGDARGALELMQRAVELDDADLYVLALADEIAAGCGADAAAWRAELVARQLDIVEEKLPSAPEVAALAVRLTERALVRGDAERADAELLRVGRALDATDEDSAATSPSLARDAAWASRLAERLALDIGALRVDRAAMSLTYRALADGCGIAGLERAYRLRAVQLSLAANEALTSTALGAEEADVVQEAIAQLERCREARPADPHVGAALTRLCLATADTRPLIGLFEAIAAVESTRRPRLLRWAALTAEFAAQDRKVAAQLRRDGLLDGSDATGFGDLQRLFRRDGATARLIDTYQRDADASDDPARAALLWGVVAMIQLKSGQLREAESSAREALGHGETDLLALAVRCAVLRADEQRDQLVHALDDLSKACGSPHNRGTCLRELAVLSDDPGAERRYLEQARLQNADDVETLSHLARHYEQTEGFAEAVKLRQQLAESEADPVRAARAFVEVGMLYSHKLDNVEHALKAFREAARLDPENEVALSELARAYRTRGDYESLLAVLERRLENEQGPRARSDLQLEIAAALDNLGADPERVMTAHLEAVRFDLGNDEAVLALQRAAGKHDRWELLEQALAALPERDIVLDVRADALRQLGRLDELHAVRRQLFDNARSPVDLADRAYDLGAVHERMLDIDGAIACYRRAIDEVPAHRPSLRALQRIYEAAGDLPAYRLVLNQELESTQDNDRRVELLLEVARTDEAGGLADTAADLLEQALELSPSDPRPIERLEAIYLTVNAPLDLARILEHRANVEEDDDEAAMAQLRAAEIYVAQGDDKRAAKILAAAASRAPGSRDVFTAYEAFCYERELWREVMEMYEGAVQFVEGGGGRAYRLSDLYARRGQLQLRYLDQPGEAAASYLSALEHDPKSESAMRALESIFLHQEDWLGLVRAYEHRASLLPENELFRLESLRQAARLATSRLPSDSDDALRLWRDVHASDPKDGEAAENLEAMLEAREMWPELVDAIEARLDAGFDPTRSLQGNELAETISAHLELAQMIEERLDDPERAARAYERVRAVEEHNERALTELARIYEATGEWERCIEALRDLVIIEADRDERSLLYFKCGSIMEAAFDDDDAAIDYYRRSLRESAGCLPSVHGLRDIYLRRSLWEDALDTLAHERRLWEGESEQAGVLARMAQIRLERLGDRVKAIEEYEDALAIDPECQPALAALFSICFEDGEDKRALDLADRLAPHLAAEGDREQRSRFFCRRGELLARAQASRLAEAAESTVYGLELWPQNLEALAALIALFRRDPEAYDYASTFRDLEQIYRGEGNDEAISHVLIAAGAVYELAGDAEEALEHYKSAEELDPQSFGAVRARARLLVGLRRATEADEAYTAFAARVEDEATRVEALCALAELHADVLRDAQRAAELLTDVVARAPRRLHAAHFLAQQFYVLERYDNAQRVVDDLLERAEQTSPAPRASELARYHHYRGVVLARTAGPTEAATAFRRALQLDPSCPEAAMALARYRVERGQRAEALDLLAHSVHEADRRDQGAGARELRRSLAALYVADERFDLARDVQRAVLDAGHGTAEDHLALATIYAGDPVDGDGVTRAIDELRAALAKNPLDPRVFAELAELYERIGERQRAARVLEVIALLAGGDRQRIEALRADRRAGDGAVVGERARALLESTSDGHVEQMWRVVRPALERVFPLELEDDVVAVAEVARDEFTANVERCATLLGVEADLRLATNVPGGVVADGNAVTIDMRFVERTETEVAFAVSRTLELLRSGHGLVSRLALDDRQLLVELLSSLLEPQDRRSDLAEEFVRRLPDKTLAAIDEAASAYQADLANGSEAELPARWLASVDHDANGLGLVACDDIASALRMSATLAGEELALGPEGTVAVKAVSGGPQMVSLYLSDAYAEVLRRLG